MKAESLGQRLKEKRIECGLTQFEVADALGVHSPQLVSNFKREVVKPSCPQLKATLKYFRSFKSERMRK